MGKKFQEMFKYSYITCSGSFKILNALKLIGLIYALFLKIIVNSKWQKVFRASAQRVAFSQELTSK